jgi:delta 1-pyrroline-5-carboxylate dehydrogenase
MYSHKKTGPKAGFFVPCARITWQGQRQQAQLPSGQQRQQAQLPSGQQLLQGQLPSEQQLQQQAARREQQLLLSCRMRSWKQPAAQPGGRNISFDFPLLANIRTHTRDRSGTCNPADAQNSNKSAKENHYLLKN